MTITNEQLNKLLKNTASKKDLKDLMKKFDLRMDKLESRTDSLEKKLDKTLLLALENRENYFELKNKFDHMDQKMDRVIDTLDGLTKKVTDFQAELASNQKAHDRFEKRITKLELKTGNV